MDAALILLLEFLLDCPSFAGYSKTHLNIYNLPVATTMLANTLGGSHLIFYRNSANLMVTAAERSPKDVLTIIVNAAQTSQAEICSHKDGMTDDIRNIVLTLHNSYRSDLALGKVKKHDGSLLPQAGAMMQMEYLCEIEDIAYDEASKCPATEIPRDVVGPLEEENFALINKTDASDANKATEMRKAPNATLLQAIQKWWSTVQTDPTPYDKHFHVMDRHTKAPLMSFIRMAWHETWAIGCGVKECGDHYTVICRYRWGITLDTPLYWQGRPCSECWETDICHATKGLCIE